VVSFCRPSVVLSSLHEPAKSREAGATGSIGIPSTSLRASPIDKSGLLPPVQPYLPVQHLSDADDNDNDHEENQANDEYERAEDVREYHAEQVGEELDYVNR